MSECKVDNGVGQHNSLQIEVGIFALKGVGDQDMTDPRRELYLDSDGPSLSMESPVFRREGQKTAEGDRGAELT